VERPPSLYELSQNGEYVGFGANRVIGGSSQLHLGNASTKQVPCKEKAQLKLRGITDG